VLTVDHPCSMELIAVDDCSTDMTPQLLWPFTDRGVYHGDPFGEPRQGRRCAHWYPESDRCASSSSTPILNIHPRTSPATLLPALDGVADHVYGTPILGFNARFSSYRFAKVERFTTEVANVLFDSCITDMHTLTDAVSPRFSGPTPTVESRHRKWD
jgi:dolichol-phosphate hexosyltransferase